MVSSPLAGAAVQSPTADFSYGATSPRASAPDLPGRAPVLAIFVDRPHLREQLREDALVAGFRVAACRPLATLAEGEGRAMAEAGPAEVVLVDCPRPDAASLAALARLDLRAGQSGAQLIVSTTSAGLEDVFALLDQSAPQILVDAGETELALALGRALALAPGRSVREMADEDRLQLLRLTEQVGRLAARLGDAGAAAASGRMESPAVAFRGASAEEGIHLRGALPVELPDPRQVRRMLRQRQQRARFFDAELFADPAWDMLLDLTAARAEQKRVSVTSLCIASGVPPTTALRWISQMTRAGLFERVEDKHDRRRAFIGLTDAAADGMGRYFEAIGAAALTSTSGANTLPV